jgi:spore coat protein I
MNNEQYMAGLIGLAKEVLSNYGIIPGQISVIQDKRLKTLWKFDYNGQRMCLKRLRHTLDKALFSVYAQLHILDNGGNVPEVYLNLDGNAITIYNEELFVLYGWVDGRDLNFGNPDDLYLAIKGLAEMHRASVGYLPPEGARVSSKLGKWPDQYQSMRNKLAEWRELSGQYRQRPEYACYLKYADQMVEMADRAISSIQDSDYDSITSGQAQQYPLCHQDYGKGNALLAERGVYVLDLDGVTHDLVIRDLRKIIGKQMEDGIGWNRDRINTILECYQETNKLSAEEKQILSIDLLFPHWFFAEMKNLFKKNKMVEAKKIEGAAVFELSKCEVLQNL